MIVIRARRIVGARSVSISEVDELLRLYTASAIDVIPRSIPDVEHALRNGQQIVTDELLRFPSTIIDSSERKHILSKGERIPHEVWTNISNLQAGNSGFMGYCTASGHGFAHLRLVCRRWAEMWGPIVYNSVKIRSATDVHVLAGLLRPHLPGLPPLPRTSVKNLLLSSSQPIHVGSRRTWTRPWLHTAYIQLHGLLLANNPELAIEVSLLVEGEQRDGTPYPWTVHDMFPRPVRELHSHCRQLFLANYKLSSTRDVMSLIRGLGVSSSATLRSVSCVSDVAIGLTPTTIRWLSLIRVTHCESYFALLASRWVNGAVYALRAEDVTLISDMLRALQLGEEVAYYVAEVAGNDGHLCVKYWLVASNQWRTSEWDIKVVLLICTADAWDSNGGPLEGKQKRRKKYTLRFRSATCYLDNTPPEKQPKWVDVMALLRRVPTLSPMVIGCTDEVALHHALQAIPRTAGELVLARRESHDKTKNFLTEWTKIDVTTGRPTGERCPYKVHNWPYILRDSVNQDVVDLAFETAGMYGLDAFLPQCSHCPPDSRS